MQHAPATELFDCLEWRRQMKRLKALSEAVEPLCPSIEERTIGESLAEQALAGRHRLDILEPFRIHAQPEPPPRARRVPRLQLITGGTP